MEKCSMPGSKTWMIAIFLTSAVLLAFWQLNYCDFIPEYDDSDYVTKNSHIKDGVTAEGIRWAFTATHAANWHPLTWLSHMLDVQLFGLNPQGHHLTNLFFHIANTLLLFLILHRMTKALWQSAFVAALFALHPLHVESVVWVSERKDVLSTFFWMLTMGAYLHYVKQPEVKRYLSVMVLFVLGLMAKPMLVTLPFVLLLLDFWPLKRFRQWDMATKAGQPAGRRYQWAVLRPLLGEKIPLFILSALSSIVTYMVQHQAGAVVSSEAIPLSLRVSNALVSYIFYIDKMLWPTDLALLYPYERPWPTWLVAGTALPTIAATVMVILKAKRFPYLAVGWLWYVGTLVPVIGLVQVGIQTRADRYTYIPLIGLFIIVAWGIPEFIRGWRYRKEALAALAAVILLCLFPVTWMQVGYWRNSISLFDHILQVTNRNSIMYNNRGAAYAELRNYPRAIEDFDKAIEIDPKYSKPYYNRGKAYGYLGDHARALGDLDRAVALNPKEAMYYYNRGLAYGKLDEHTRAIENFNRAIEIDPKLTIAYYDRGMAYGKLGNYAKGYDNLKKAARLGSEDAKNFLRMHGIDWQ